MSSISKTIEKLRNPEYRSGFVDSLISINVPFQIRALVKSRGWTQERLAERSGMLQPRISAIMTPGKTRPNIKTLRRIAEAFDCGLVVRFVPFGELVKWTHRFDPENFHVASFGEEIEALEQEPKAVGSDDSTKFYRSLKWSMTPAATTVKDEVVPKKVEEISSHDHYVRNQLRSGASRLVDYLPPTGTETQFLQVGE